MAEPRDKAEGWYLLHDLRRIDWASWNAASDREKQAAVEAGEEYLRDVADAEEGGSAVYSVVGNDADLMLVHVRPTLEEIDALQRRFDATPLADHTDRGPSFVSVAEVGGYTNEDVEEDELSPYAEKKLFPKIPDKRYVSFYPMSRKRDPEQNWYLTDLEHRGEMMHEHRETGEAYAGKIEQLISGAVGLDDWEWGVDLFTDDMKHAKQIVYEMRFDEASAVYSEFGPFYTGVRFPPEDLGAFMAAETVPTDGATGDGADGDAGTEVRDELREQGVYAGQPKGEDVHAVVLFSEEDPDALAEEVDGLRGNFEHYDTHVDTQVYRDTDHGDDATDDRRAAIVSLWDTADAADTAAGYLSDLPGVTGRADEGEGWGTMGMFYEVEPEYREEFHDVFGDVGAMLADMEGHRDTRLYANTKDANDMFISSRWASRDDAMQFFKSDDFRDTVDWGREVLAGRPRHVFLA
jgi:chlorite dismutase